MASKVKSKVAIPANELRNRIDRSLQDGRSQHALEMARTLFKQEPTQDHRELLQRATLERARQLRSGGMIREAVTVLNNAMDLGGEDFLARAAEELCKCGEFSRVVGLVEKISDDGARARLLAHAADAALSAGPAGKVLIPKDYQPQFDLILQAFGQVEAGQDEAARTALQAIGLNSPFLEWKVFLRGLLAYYQKDDNRALENWQRLDAGRVPARLAGPFRALIDPAFLQAQPAAMQAQLRKQGDLIQGSALASSLRDLEKTLHDPKGLAQAFRQAEKLWPLLKQKAPAQAPRLANCFYWTIIENGNPEDMHRFLRVFGNPPDDPHFQRLQGLALERRHDLDQAQSAWQEYDRWLAGNPSWGPPEQRNRARALIWCHMGSHSTELEEEFDGLPSSFPGFPGFGKPAKPKFSPEECFHKSLELAPNLRDVHEALFAYCRNKGKPEKAIAAGENLLKIFPDHVPTLEALGDLYLEQKQESLARERFLQAMRVNPLEKRLRSKATGAYLHLARSLVEKKNYPAAAVQFEAALGLAEGPVPVLILAQWAACEFKAGNPEKAEERLTRARTLARIPLQVDLVLAIESERMKLPAPLKKQFLGKLSGALEQPPQQETAVELVNALRTFRLAKIAYRGQKKHENMVVAYLERAFSLPWTEDQLEIIIISLQAMKFGPLANRFILEGRRLYPANPAFLILKAEEVLFKKNRRVPYQAIQDLNEAQKLAEDMPHGDRRDVLLHKIHELKDMSQMRSMPFSPLDMLEEFMGFYEDDDEDDDDDF